MSIREASHAGSWYSSSKSELSAQLDGWLANVSAPVTGIGPLSKGETVDALPVSGARIIIAPHAGYSYSGPAAAWAYKSWDVSKAKRVFVIGPSHHVYLTKCALTKCDEYETPLGNLTVDKETTQRLFETGKFQWMSQQTDEDEHSLEMHLPYIHKILSKNFSTPAQYPKLVPIMVGNTSPSSEKTYGQLLAPYLADPSNAFVISSDFAHWGSRFRYTYYIPSNSSSTPTTLRPTDRSPRDPPIHESIKKVDFRCIGACEGGRHDEWTGVLEETGNTVCGRHPIGIVMAALEGSGTEGKGRFRFVRYERSSECVRVGDSSVSYCSAFAVL